MTWNQPKPVDYQRYMPRTGGVIACNMYVSHTHHLRLSIILEPFPARNSGAAAMPLVEQEGEGRD